MVFDTPPTRYPDAMIPRKYAELQIDRRNELPAEFPHGMLFGIHMDGVPVSRTCLWVSHAWDVCPPRRVKLEPYKFAKYLSEQEFRALFTDARSNSNVGSERQSPGDREILAASGTSIASKAPSTATDTPVDEINSRCLNSSK